MADGSFLARRWDGLRYESMSLLRPCMTLLQGAALSSARLSLSLFARDLTQQIPHEQVT